MNSYAGYAGGQSNSVVLREMQVYVVLQEGEDLTFGIKTSNRKNDGSQATDNSGWFKCDYFRIEKVETTGVRTTAMSSDAGTNWYSLDGHRLPGSAPRQRGVFIQNRKKVAVL